MIPGPSQSRHTPSTAIPAIPHKPEAMALPHCTAKHPLVPDVRPFTTGELPSTPHSSYTEVIALIET